MSLTFTVDVFCDRCSDWIHGATGKEITGLRKKARVVARRAGWRCTPFGDRCPNCIKGKHEDDS